jgi:WD40 repeat protein
MKRKRDDYEQEFKSRKLHYFIGRQDVLIYNTLSFLPIKKVKELGCVSYKWKMVSDQIPFQGICTKVLKDKSHRMNLLVLGDGKTLCSGSLDKTIRVWNVEQGTCMKILEGHTGNIRSLIVLGDGKTLCSGSNDNAIRVWDIEKGTCMKVLEDHNGCVISLVVLGDGKTLCAGANETIRVWW